jgi:hypothetical protein
VIAPHLGADDRFRERFRREAMLQAALEHPNIVTVYETGESEEGLFLAMRLVRGTNLKQLVLDCELEPARALAILAQVASALDAAHEAGLIHRDVKPQNVLVDASDHAYLADFGLIKSSTHRGVTGTGQYLGSLSYVSPEQIRGEPVSALSDVYAFAAVLYECLAGDVPFPADSEAALLYAHLSEPPPRVSAARPELPAGLDAVVARGLAKRPEDRYRTASALVANAQNALGEPGATPTPAARQAADRSNGRAPAVRDRFDDTIVDAGPLRPRPEIALEPERRLSRVALGVVVAAVLALAAAGFVLGRSRDRVAHPTTGLAFGGQLSLAFPKDEWRRAPRTERVRGLTFEDPIALESSEPESPGELRAGMLRSAEGPLLLPNAFVAGLSARPRPEQVRLGSLAALRYRGLRGKGVEGPFTLFVVPTDRGAAGVACLGGRSETGTAAERTFLRRCEEVATTLELGASRPRPLGRDRAYAAAAARTLGRLDARRARERRRLGAATLPAAQARAAARLAGAYRAAGAAVGKLKPGLVARPAHRALVAALGRAGAGYSALAAAARTGNRRAYARAAAVVTRAEAQVDRAARSFAR